MYSSIIQERFVMLPHGIHCADRSCFSAEMIHSLYRKFAKYEKKIREVSIPLLIDKYHGFEVSPPTKKRHAHPPSNARQNAHKHKTVPTLGIAADNNK